MADPATASTSGVTATIASIIPIILGGVTTYFKIFITPKDEFRNRTKLKRVGLRERVATKLTLLLQHVRSLGPDDLLRGDGREDADLVGDYMEETFRTFTVFHRLSILDSIIRCSYLFLYLSILAGMGGMFCGWLIPVTRDWVLGIAVALVIMQALIVLGIQLASWKLDEYEDVT